MENSRPDGLLPGEAPSLASGVEDSWPEIQENT